MNTIWNAGALQDVINNRFVALAAVSLAAVVAATSGAHAGAFAVREQSATAQGMSFAGAASGSGGISSMFWTRRR